MSSKSFQKSEKEVEEGFSTEGRYKMNETNKAKGGDVNESKKRDTLAYERHLTNSEIFYSHVNSYFVFYKLFVL